MKSVGIINYHGAHNYGSALQAYAIRKTVEKLGYHAETINFRSQNQKDLYKTFVKNRNLNAFIINIFKLVFYKDHSTKKKQFENFIHEYLNISQVEFNSMEEINKNPPLYDQYICGSDQIWNMNCPDYEDAYFLTFAPKGSKKIAYAPSFGTTFFSKDVLSSLKGLINQMDYLSVREQQGAKLIKELTGKDAEVVLDPTLLVSSKEWSEIAIKPKIEKPYILCYFLNNNMGDRRFLEYFKEKTGFKVVILNDYVKDILKGYKRCFNAGPREFIGLFQNASLIYTNSFHGVVFSNIFEKPFFVSVGDSLKSTVNNTDSRKIDFLKAIGLTSRIVFDQCPKEEDIFNISFKKSRTKLNELRQKSQKYLSKSLNDVVWEVKKEANI